MTRFAMITFLDGRGGAGIDNSLPGGGGGNVDNSLPGGGYGGGRPDNSLPGGPTQLPVYPFDPTLPDGGGGHPSTGPIVPGKKFVVKWLACVGLILVPDNELPETPEPK